MIKIKKCRIVEVFFVGRLILNQKCSLSNFILFLMEERIMKRILLMVVLSALLAACTTTVSLKLKNPTDVAQSPRVIVQNDKGIEKETLNLGKLQPKGELLREFEVPHSSNIVIKSSTDMGYDVCDLPPYSIPTKPDPYTLSVDLCLTGNLLLSDANGIAAIGDALADMGQNIGFTPISVKDGLSTWFGALAVLVPANKDHPQQLLYLIQPARFTGRAITLDEFQYPSSISSRTVQVIGKSSAGVAASVPLYGSIGVDTTSENLYNLEWSMNGYGFKTKVDPNGWSIQKAITSLPTREKKLLYDALNKERDAVLWYVNKIYVIKNADFHVKEGKKLATTAKLTASTFLTTNGAWSFDSSNDSHQQFQELVLNIGGITVPVNILRVENKKASKSFSKSFSKSLAASWEGEHPSYVYEIATDETKPQKEMLLSGAAQKQINNE